jgi:FHA domain-containing protein
VITLTVKSFNGAPADGPSFSFDELGGTIGRADTNQLVLPDPERTISRVHAQVVFRNGGFALVDRGSNPIAVNGRALGSGVEAPIRAGDQVQIGGYLLSVEAARAATPAADPFADLLAPPGRPAAGHGAPPDPLAGFGAPPPAARGAASPADPFAPRGRPAAPSSAGGIPDDWNPFAPDAPAPPSQDLARSLGRGGGGGFGLDATPGAPPPLIPDLPGHGSGGDSIDALFGLKPGGGADPLANSKLDAAAAQPNMAASSDPMQSLKSAPRGTAPTARDDLSDLNRPFSPTVPQVRRTPATPPATPPAAPPATPEAAPPMPRGAVLSWDDHGGETRTVINPRAGSRSAPAGSADAEPDTIDPLAAFGIAPAAPVASPAPSRPAAAPAEPAPSAQRPAAAAPRQAPASADVQALLAAFREGLATPSLQLDALTPELMRLIGQLLHEAASGTVDLLVARAALKQELRAQATMIVARENNPLKFSPSAEAALTHLLAPPTRGFMPAAPAMRDAYQDLRAHQYGFVAGMRAALEGVLERFDPALLEGRLTQPSALQALLPGSRKARLWELFSDLYAQIRAEAADDFHAVFGKAFLKAYEEHIEQLHRNER